jgi:hypothetical protein
MSTRTYTVRIPCHKAPVQIDSKGQRRVTNPRDRT